MVESAANRQWGRVMNLVWKDDYSVGVEALDFDHKLLFSLINQLDGAIADQEGEDVLGSVLGVLAEYTRYHFMREEKLMSKGGYPEIGSHHGRHEALTRRVNELKDKFDARHPQAAMEVRDFLAEWLTSHILSEDQAYREHVRGCQLTAEEEVEILEKGSTDDPAHNLG